MNQRAFLDKLRGAAVIARHGATEGERAAGQAAVTRLLDRAVHDSRVMPITVAHQFLGDAVALARAAGVASHNAWNGLNPSPRPSPDPLGRSAPAPNPGAKPLRQKNPPILDLYL